MTELVEWWHDEKTFIGTPQQLVDELNYGSYRYNRQRRPEIPAHEWEVVFGSKTVVMEQRYHYELAKSSCLLPSA